MPLDRIITDPIISTDNATFTPSCSCPPTEGLPVVSSVILTSERDLLLGAPKPKKPFYRARPLWLVPFALTASITRGMTLAPRVEVFTELSCRQLHGDYTSILDILDIRPIHAPLHTQAAANTDLNSLYLQSTSPTQSLKESQGDGDTEGDDPRVIPGQKCMSDPAVQAGAAKLQTIMTSTMGALSALTTGWWGHFGERYGRTRVLAISTLGLFLTDLIFILVSTPHNPLASHSHKLLILAPVIEGLLGGWSSLTGANTAYIADCTSPGSRATVFARFTGVVFVGLALGPITGAWLIRNPIPFLRVGQADHPLQSVNSVFWVAICGSFVNLLLVLFVFPESLPASRRAGKGKNCAMEGDEIKTSNKDKGWIVVRAVKDCISPLAEFLPTDVVTRQTGIHSQSYTHKDWSLTYLALSLFVYNLSSGLIQLKYLYAEHIYDWTAEQLSYYISFLGGGRALHLLVLLPFLLTTFKPAREAVSSALSSRPNTNDPKVRPKPTKSRLSSEICFDLFIVQCSMFVDFVSHALVVLSPLPSNDATSTWWSQLKFVGASSLTCAGAGVMPAAQSLALCTLQGRKLAEKEIPGGAKKVAKQDAVPASGELFGAISALQAVGQTIVGPIMFGVLYSNTVASFPKAIFAVAAVLVIIALALTVFVRPDVSLCALGTTQKKRKSTAASGQYVEERRGRSRARKDLRGGAASASYGAVRYDPSVSSGKTETSHSAHA